MLIGTTLGDEIVRRMEMLGRERLVQKKKANTHLDCDLIC